MAKFAQGYYEPKNPQKYVGIGKIKYRSGWEMTFMMFCDNNDKVIKWASESIRIPYRNPLTGKQTIYVPDFFIVYQGRDGSPTAEVVEIKPSKQTSLQEAGKSRRDQAAAIVNQAKWRAAGEWCRRNGVTFRVITEHDIFHQGKKR
jgi:hypothetical protein